MLSGRSVWLGMAKVRAVVLVAVFAMLAVSCSDGSASRSATSSTESQNPSDAASASTTVPSTGIAPIETPVAGSKPRQSESTGTFSNARGEAVEGDDQTADNQAPGFFTLPAAPQGMSAMINRNRVTLSWSAPVNDGGTPITAYEVSAVSESEKSCSSPGSVTSCVISGLTYGSTYGFEVVAQNAMGKGPTAITTNVFIPITVPDVPYLATTTRTGNEVLIAWVPPADDGGSIISGYSATAVNHPGMTCVRTQPAFACKVGQLDPSFVYEFTVTATNSVGASSESEPSVPAGTRQVTSSGVDAVIDYALSRITSPYVWAAQGPDVFDTSGFARWAYLKVGVNLRPFTQAMWQSTIRISESQLQPGDLIFYGIAGFMNVQIYLGRGLAVGAAFTLNYTRLDGTVRCDGYPIQDTMFAVVELEWSGSPIAIGDCGLRSFGRIPAEQWPS
jgi:cell wall-associated NlpC family hydrolase